MYNLDPYDPPPYFPTRPHYPPGADYIVSPTEAPSKKNCLKPFQAFNPSCCGKSYLKDLTVIKVTKARQDHQR